MATERPDASGPGRRRPRDVAALTAWLMVMALVPLGVIALLLWPFGLLPGASTAPVVTALIGGGAVADAARERPRRWGVAAAVGALVVAATGALGFTVALLVSPPAADLALQAGILLGLPPGAGLFTWVGNRRNPPAPAAAAGG
ncbi:hypothetical protein PV350_39745 [Streptomyces sp. PA03-6a]|nr:hypothetical protein [Streptomyces sp. PA03-6a]